MFSRLEIRGALTAFALVVACFLVGAHISLGIPGQPLLQSLRFHIAALLVVISFCLLVSGAGIRAALFALFSATSISYGWWIIHQQQAVRPAASAMAGLPEISVLHFNMLSSNTANGRKIADLVTASGAAFAFLPEAMPVTPYLADLRKTYPHQIGCTVFWTCDLLFLSRYKLSDTKIHSLGKFSANRVFTAYADVDGQRIGIVAVHLTKPYFDDAARDEIAALVQIINAMDGPLVIAGDFNAAAWSRNLRDLLRFANLVPGPSYPGTWPPEAGPLAVPIDNIFTRAPAILTDIAPLPDALGSNHRGLTGKFVVLPATP